MECVTASLPGPPAAGPCQLRCPALPSRVSAPAQFPIHPCYCPSPDGDALPDPHWLRYLALRFMEREGNATWAAVGGRSLAPLGYGTVADSLAYAPGEAGNKGFVNGMWVLAGW